MKSAVFANGKLKQSQRMLSMEQVAFWKHILNPETTPNLQQVIISFDQITAKYAKEVMDVIIEGTYKSEEYKKNR
jgi:hypothetical protein